MNPPSQMLGAAALAPMRLSRRGSKTLSLGVRFAREALRAGRSTPLQRAERMSCVARAFCKIHNIDLRVQGTFPPGPKVVVVNHLGYIDPMVLGAVQPLLPIAKSEVGSWPLVGLMGRRMGVQFVIRQNPYSGFRVLRRAARDLRAGASVLNFAEGTTSMGDDVLPFHRGIFGIARHTGARVVPVRMRFAERAMAWVGDDPFLPHYLRFASGAGTEVELEILESLDPRDFASAQGLADAARSRIREGLRLTALAS